MYLERSVRFGQYLKFQPLSEPNRIYSCRKKQRESSPRKLPKSEALRVNRRQRCERGCEIEDLREGEGKENEKTEERKQLATRERETEVIEEKVEKQRAEVSAIPEEKETEERRGERFRGEKKHGMKGESGGIWENGGEETETEVKGGGGEKEREEL